MARKRIYRLTDMGMGGGPMGDHYSSREVAELLGVAQARVITHAGTGDRIKGRYLVETVGEAETGIERLAREWDTTRKWLLGLSGADDRLGGRSHAKSVQTK